ncbi:MFS transporter [Chitinibacteraceae bacterium HSL-7]
MHAPNQFDLFRTRRFVPLFLTQFAGAFNDNLFKNALLVLLTFHGLSLAGLDSGLLVNAAAGVFILPFFLFSALAGQLAEKYDKAVLARATKVMEIGIMVAGGVGFGLQNIGLLFACLFLMGAQSALFGPLKYSVLPQYLRQDELLGGNGLIEAGTFVAILIGQIAGTVIVSQEGGEHYIIVATVLFAVFGWLASRSMPSAPAPAPDLKISWNIAGETWRILKHVHANRTVFNCLLGISWFWFFGAVYLTQLPAVAQQTLGGTPAVYTLLMTLFSAGIGIGSLLCEKLSGRQIEIGLVPFGSIGLSLFGIDLYFALAHHVGSTHTLASFIETWAGWRVMLDIVLLGVFGGFFIVPLYAMVQTRSEKEYVSRAIAANNILNSFFMVVASLMGIALLSAGMSVPMLLLTVALMNIAVAVYIYTLIPEFLMRFLVWILTHTLYRIDKKGLEHIPAKGPCLLVCNHVSFMDALIIAGAIRRPVRFVMDHRIFSIPVLSFIFRTAGAIPIASARENADIKARAFDRIAEYLSAGEVVCIFPEGGITRTGDIQSFRPGVEDILRRTPVLTVPMALQGLWGSFFSRKDGAAMMKMPRKLFARIGLIATLPIPAAEASRQRLEAEVRTLRGEVR